MSPACSAFATKLGPETLRVVEGPAAEQCRAQHHCVPGVASRPDVADLQGDLERAFGHRFRPFQFVVVDEDRALNVEGEDKLGRSARLFELGKIPFGDELFLPHFPLEMKDFLEAGDRVRKRLVGGAAWRPVRDRQRLAKVLFRFVQQVDPEGLPR